MVNNQINKNTKQYAAPEAGSKLWNKYYCLIIAMACCTNFANHFIGSSFSLWIVDMGRSNTIYGTIHSLFSLVAMLARPFTGWIIDHGNRKVAFIVSCIVYGTSLVLMLYSPIFGLFIGLRLIQGVGHGCIYTVCNNSGYDYMPPDKMEKGVGYLALSSSLVSALTASFSVSTYQSKGPSAIVLYCVIAYVIAIILSLNVVFRTASDQRKFNIREVFNISNLFEKRALAPCILSAFSVNFAFGLRSYIILYGRSMGFKNPGWFTTVSAIGLLVVRLVLDAIPKKEGSIKRRMTFAYAVFVVYLVLLFFCKNIYTFLFAAVLWAVVYGILDPQLQSMAIKSAPLERRGATGSTFLCSMDIGIILGSFIGGVLADKFGYQYMFIFAIIPVVLCIVYFLVSVSKKIEN